MKIIFATHNQKKITELMELFLGLSVEFLSMDDVGIADDPAEDGSTLQEMAAKKALFIAEKIKGEEWVLAENSGIFIKALGDEPGAFSDRWLGEGVPGEKLASFTLARMKPVPSEERSAYFECVMALIEPKNGKLVSFTGKVNGMLSEEARGNADRTFPYDTIFVPEGSGGKTFAELTDDEKNGISHRARAAEQVQSFLIERGLLHSSEE